jgi:pimeloyl-ACP methyl ester carboxylesterase
VDGAVVRLEGGRRLGYREYGDPAGRPLVSCHGGLVCGLDAAPLEAHARSLSIRLIAPDRPGIGGSDPAPGRTTADGAGDVTGLLDALGIDRAAVLGWSMGGQYALACAALAPDRITAAVVVAGALPLDDPATLAALNAMDRRLTALARRRPRLARAAFRLMGAAARRAPAAWTRALTQGAVPDERAALAGPSGRTLARAAATALRGGTGMVEEYRAWSRPWGFAPEEVACPTVVWQGGDDHLIPARWGAELVRRIPDARLAALPGSGHFLIYAHAREVLASTAGA